MGPIFNEKVAKKWNLWVHEQYIMHCLRQKSQHLRLLFIEQYINSNRVLPKRVKKKKKTQNAVAENADVLSKQRLKLQHYQRNLTNMNATTHIYQRIKPQHLSNFINHSPKREIEWVFGLRLSVCLGWRLLCFSFCVFFFFSHVFSPLAATIYVRYMNSSRNFWPVFVNGTSVHCLRTYKFHFLSIFSLKMGLMTPFTYLKIILLQWFQ